MSNEEKIEPAAKEEIIEGEKPKKINSKILIVGLPLFIIQLIAVYFITANILLTQVTNAGSEDTHDEKTEKQDKKNTEKKAELGKFIFSIEDVIVNPADTGGKRLLLTSIGFDLSEEVLINEFKSKEILLKDVIISALSSKSLNQLSDTAFKDSIKTEISDRVSLLLPNIKLNAVYISKYIIQ